MKTNIPILILHATRAFTDDPTSEINSWYRLGLTEITRGDLFRANIVIIRGPTHFCCIKNRWGITSPRDRIPNGMLHLYLIQYVKNFKTEDLLNALCYHIDANGI